MLFNKEVSKQSTDELLSEINAICKEISKYVRYGMKETISILEDRLELINCELLSR